MMRRRDILASTLAGTTALPLRNEDLGAADANSTPSSTSNPVHFVRRGFVRAEGRGVHYVRAGHGPAVVLLHSAGNASARLTLPLLQRLISDHTVFAFDLPGYGDSDSLPRGTSSSIADAADVVSAAMHALMIPRCPVYGSHTGGSVALELARRHSALTSAVVVDGPAVFTPAEAKYYRSEQYLPPFTVKDDGSHLFAAWVKARDSAMWFPWSKRGIENRQPWPFPSPEGLHDAFVDELRAGDGYRDVYGAAFNYDLRAAAASVTVPATFMAQREDLLYPHLDRLPEVKSDQRIVRSQADPPAFLDEVARVLRDYDRTMGLQVGAPAEASLVPTSGVVNRRYVDFPDGQLLVRSAGEDRHERPLLLLHEGRASSRAFEALMRELGRYRPVYAPDLPDNGASDALASAAPRIDDYAAAVAHMAVALKITHADMYAVGAGAAVAVHLLAQPQFSSARAVLEAPDFYDVDFAARLGRDWAPVLKPEWDGAHINRIWLMLRDEYAFWPWFDKSPAAACAVQAPPAEEINARVTDILRSLSTYHRLISAALRYPWQRPLLATCRPGVTLAIAEKDPRRPHVEAAARVAGRSDVAILPNTTQDAKAQEILRLLKHLDHGVRHGIKFPSC